MATDDRSSTSTTSSTTSTTSSADLDDETAFDANITVEDLPSGWEECCPPFFAEPDLLSINTCEDPAIAPSTAGFVREFSYMADERGVEQGHLVSQVFVSPTEQDAAAKLSCVDSDAYRQRTIEAAENRILERALVEHGPLTSSYELQVLTAGDQATVDRIRTTYEVVGHGTGWTHQDSIRMRIGRITYRILISSYADAPTTEALERWAALLAARTAAS